MADPILITGTEDLVVQEISINWYVSNVDRRATLLVIVQMNPILKKTLEVEEDLTEAMIEEVDNLTREEAT